MKLSRSEPDTADPPRIAGLLARDNQAAVPVLETPAWPQVRGADSPERHADAWTLARAGGPLVDLCHSDETGSGLRALSVLEPAAQAGFWMAAKSPLRETHGLCPEMDRSAAPTAGPGRCCALAPCPLPRLSCEVAP